VAPAHFGLALITRLAAARKAEQRAFAHARWRPALADGLALGIKTHGIRAVGVQVSATINAKMWNPQRGPDVFAKTNTIWENYTPDSSRQGDEVRWQGKKTTLEVKAAGALSLVL
jgi:hypothetical protein